jgi:hypothetical protein
LLNSRVLKLQCFQELTFNGLKSGRCQWGNNSTGPLTLDLSFGTAKPLQLNETDARIPLAAGADCYGATAETAVFQASPDKRGAAQG